jgi:hypothetical protein
MTVRGTRALTAGALLVGVWLLIAIAELSGVLPGPTHEAWAEVVVSAKDAISHE